MNQRKKTTKRILLVSIFTVSIILTSTPLISLFSPVLVGPYDEESNNNEINNLSLSSDPYLSDYYLTGSGDDQDVRIYATNTSSSNINNQEYFDIPSISSIDDSNLVSGDFNFTFQNNFTTTHVMEDTYALNASNFIEFDINTAGGYSDITLQNGTSSDLNLADLTDGNLNSDCFIEAENGLINLTLKADFADTDFTNTNPDIDVAFHRNLIIGFLVSLDFDISRNATLTIMMKDITSSNWINVSERIFLDSTLGTHDIDRKIINENLKYINLANESQVQFYFKRFNSLAYNVTLREMQDTAIYGFDLPITNTNQVALEFDLRGTSSTVNGFYGWIRTLNTSLALNSELNVSLYRSDTTVKRTSSNLRSDTMEPDFAEIIDSFLLDYNAYHDDSITYFEFDNLKTKNLALNNYFIVIKSNRSDIVYSLATIPRETFGDPDLIIDHQLKMSGDAGSTWNNAFKSIPGPIAPYESEQLDASPFVLNVTRGYMPSDFDISAEESLNIQEIPIEDLVIDTGVYATSSALRWGLGRWNNNFTTEISNNLQYDYRVELNWSKTVTKGFQFNVSYNAKAYWIEVALTSYNVSYNTLPEWTFNYTFDSNHVNLAQWNLEEFWYLYPNYFDATQLINPNSEDVYNLTGKEENIFEKPLDKTVINSTLALNGLYQLQLTSPNIINSMHSYIHYFDSLLETNGFMEGDNMTVRLDIQDHNGKRPKGGTADVVLFYPDNSTKYPGTEKSSSTSIRVGDLKTYSFNNETIIAVDETVPLNNYYLGFFWTNGTAIGCKTLKVYIDAYDVELNDFFYESSLDVNVLSGLVSKPFDNYSMLVATVNETTGLNIPNFYPVNHSNINEEFQIDVSGQDIPFQLNAFLQNETILNPGESVSFLTTVQNLHEIIDLDVSINIKLVSLGNEDWIIDEVTSSTETIALKGDPSGNDIKDFLVTLNIPNLEPDGSWRGKTAPIRKGGAKTIVTIYIGGKIGGIYESQDFSLLINDSENIFEGFIKALKYDTRITSSTLNKVFQRDECSYLPASSNFFINIFDKNLLSSYNQINNSFGLNLNSRFSNIKAEPEIPIRGKVFNLTSNLETEFGNALPNKNVTLQYYDQGSWINYSYDFSNDNGTIFYEIDTLDLNEEDSFLFRLSWTGSQYINGEIQNFTIDIFRQLNKVAISLRQNEVQIYRGQKTLVSINIQNTGTSTIRITEINININPSLISEIVQLDNIKLNKLAPGGSTSILVEVEVTNIQTFTFQASLDIQNIITLENETVNTSKEFDTFLRPLEEYIQDYIALIIFGIFIAVAAVTYLIVRRSIRVIETPIEEPVKKKRRRGRYVTVSEISKEDKETPKESKEAKTDLDSLLEKEGLKEKDE